MTRQPHTFDRTEAAIDEALERRAFPELHPDPAQVPAVTRLAWHLQDELARIDAAEAILARGYIATSDYPILNVLAHRSPDEARAATQARYRAAIALAGATARMAA